MGERIVVKKRRKYKTIPFGFVLDPNDSRLVVPDPDLYRHILQARKMRRRGATLEECRIYFRKELGIDMYHMNVKRVLERSF
jgi:hypothetical protein